MTDGSFEQVARRLVEGSGDLVDELNFTREYTIRTSPNPLDHAAPRPPLLPICVQAAKLLDLRPVPPDSGAPRAQE